MMLRIMLTNLMVFVWLLPSLAQAEFGLIQTKQRFVVNSGAGLVFEVDKSTGSITSWNYNGVEYRFDETKRNSHINSGLGARTAVNAELIGKDLIKVTIQADENNQVAGGLVHYLLVKKHQNAVVMATYVAQAARVGELRWITRLWAARVPNGPVPSDVRSNTGAIESADVFGMADGTTRSKYYGNRLTKGKERAIDLTYCGATGPEIGVWMVFGNRESSSGGPFFRDIQNQCGKAQEICNYMYSGHNQTEDWRLNVLHGPYAMVFTDGKPPSMPMDFSWMDSRKLELKGWVPEADRGMVSGTVSGIPDNLEKVIGFANESAQYWVKAAPDGSFASPPMKPGKYQVTLYKQELEVASDTVTVTRGQTSEISLKAKPEPEVLWRLGSRDGTPNGFLNADKVIEMHPSDVRMADWNVGKFVVGNSQPATGIPCYQWKTTSDLQIEFELTKDQVVDSRVRIGITAAYAGARPMVSINGLQKGGRPSTQPKSRSLTIGTYRGNNKTYSFGIPKRFLVTGKNKLTITPISGSGSTGFLSAGYALDFIEWSGGKYAPSSTSLNPLPPQTTIAEE